MEWEIVIGIETHAQLATKSKMFSGAATAFGAAVNTQASGVDIALPGALPVANRAAVEHAIRFGLAVKGTIARRSIFARKNYFYPDLPKGYQISQYESPIVQGGSIGILVDAAAKAIRLTRAHLEEDAGKSLHEDFRGMTGIDLNRAGTPLLEIVSEPELRGPKEAVAYARALHALVMWIGICDGNMQEGSFRCDANVSVRKAGDTALGTRCEIKNLNSFRFMEKAIEFEARRQIGILEEGGKIEQETRLYDAERDETRSMRSKEDAQDYRYFPDPDLLPLVVSEEMIEAVRGSMPELPGAKRERFGKRIPAEIAYLLTSTRDKAEYFEASIDASDVASFPKVYEAVANAVVGDLTAQLNDANLSFRQSPLSPTELALLQQRVADGTISGKIAKDLLKAKFQGETAGIDELIDRRGLRQISDASAIEKLVDEVLTTSARLVADYRSGKEKAFNALVGQVMKASRGKANPLQAAEALRRRLG
ncbi:MAG TPA: Asp-tRNA(Asn)/Glu-tRNA(Gln) amidotransferase subunit GatB [Burkholderiales bacterium]|nr:Asp-tRNA(Asn)/Glu-tRNA(Gln) amidotransferase subunit GatB [Burkholderiales bacterium]